MHFVARSSTDTAYNSHGYTLRHDPLEVFRQPPMHLQKQHGTPTLGHRRSTSNGSAKLFNVTALTDNIRNSFTPPGESIPLLDSKPDVDYNAEKDPDSTSHVSNLVHDCKVECCKRITINVAGQKYETQLKTLNRLPSTLLGCASKRAKYWDKARNEFFFDRHRPSFPAVLYYYQSGGRLKRPVEVPADVFVEELEFYELGRVVIDSFKASEGMLIDNQDEISEGPDLTLKQVIWHTFENPGSNWKANVIGIISVSLILTSVATFCIETLPEFKENECRNVTIMNADGTSKWTLKPNFLDPLFIIESCCIAWFVFELVIRAMTSPSKVRFVKDFVNLIDFISILPYFVFLAMFLIQDSCQASNRLLNLLRVLRVVRVFKLSRFSVGLQILAKTLRVSMKELSMFILFLGIGVIIFAGAIFYAEAQNEDSFFTSIPDAFWWAVISMTTVGYGDVYPMGILGKVIGSMCVLSGLLAIALPVPVVVTNFNNIYRQTTGRGNNM